MSGSSDSVDKHDEHSYEHDETKRSSVAPLNEKDDHGEDSAGLDGQTYTDEFGNVVRSTKVKWTFKRCVAIASLCMAYVGSQILLYFVGASLQYIEIDLNIQYGNWLSIANLVGISATLPFVGYFTDLLGRRWVVIIGAGLLVIGSILVATTHSFAQAIVGMTIGGIAAGICELTAFAGVAEITPVKYRGMTLALVTVSILPFCPYVLYVNLLAIHSSWRWGLCIVGVWCALGFFGLLFCYHPPPRHRIDGMTSMDIVKRIDYVGTFLSIGGITLFHVGMQGGGYQYSWTSAALLAPLIIGVLVVIAFPFYELYGAKYPMIPKEIFTGQRIVSLSFVIAFVAGMNFYSLLNFYPIVLANFYPPDATLVGLRALGYGFSILAGACVVNVLLSYTNGHIREMLTASCLIMTGFGGALAAADPFNPGFATAMSTVGGFGVGGVLIPATTLAMYACPDAYIATTTAIALAVRFIGGAVGNTVYFNIYQSKLNTNLPKLLAQYVTEAGLPQDSVIPFVKAWSANPLDAKHTAVMKVPGVNMQVMEAAALGARWAYADSMKFVWYASIAFGIVACICCALLPNMKRFMTNRVAVDIH